MRTHLKVLQVSVRRQPAATVFGKLSTRKNKAATDPGHLTVINRGDFTSTDMDETADVVQQILGYGRRLEKYIERGNEEFKVQYLLVFKIAVK